MQEWHPCGVASIRKTPVYYFRTNVHFSVTSTKKQNLLDELGARP